MTNKRLFIPRPLHQQSPAAGVPAERAGLGRVRRDGVHVARVRAAPRAAVAAAKQERQSECDAVDLQGLLRLGGWWLGENFSLQYFEIIFFYIFSIIFFLD